MHPAAEDEPARVAVAFQITAKRRQVAITFLKSCNCRKTVNRKRTSYGWKGMVERTTGHYLRNEDFIAAAKQLNFTIQWCSGTSPNCWINISETATRGMRL